jgi:hypothetical protein
LEELVAAGIVILATGCGNSSPAAPSPQTLHAEAADPAGDSVPSAGIPVAPDLVHVTADVAGATVTFAIQFAPRTLDPATTRATVDLDTDQNPATGNAGGPMGSGTRPAV